MNRLSVKRLETIFCCIGISMACIAALLFFAPPALDFSSAIEYKLHRIFGAWALVYSGVILLSIPITCQFVLGSILFKENKGFYGFWCVLPSVIVKTHISGYDEFVIQSFISSVIGLLLSVYTAKFSGYIFRGFKSPIESLNWKEKSLNIDYETPKIWVIVFDLLISLYILTVLVMISKFTTENYMTTGLFTLLCFVGLYSHIMLRKEKLMGAALFIVIHLGIILFYALNYELLYIGYYVEPYFLSKKIGNILLFLGPLALIIYNRKRLTW